MAEQYIDSQRGEGHFDSSGEFSLAREKALQKMARFSLPFQGAWTLKVIQAIVASGSREAIDVHQLRDTTEFEFQLGEQLTLDQVEQAFFDVNSEPSEPLQHLRVALWSIGVGEERGFQLSLGGSEQLRWTGEKLVREQVSKPGRCGQLIVSHTSSQLDWLKRRTRGRRENSAVLKALVDNCFVCPLPLRVDKRRIDVLQYCPVRGWSRQSIPFLLGFGQAELPVLGVASGTYEEVEYRILSGPRYMSAKTLSCDEPDLDYYSEAPVVYLVGLRGVAQWGRDANFPIKFLPAESECYWVSDGVIVDKDAFEHPRTPFSASVFLNSSGIPSDATTLRLKQIPERKRRMKLAAQSVQQGLRDYSRQRLVRVTSRQEKSAYRDFVLTALGIGAIALKGPVLVPLAPLLMGSGLSFMSNALSAQSKTYENCIGRHYRDFQEVWAKQRF